MQTEREAVVAWLRREAAEYKDAGAFGQVSYAVLVHSADAIERGDHLKENENG